MLSYHYIAIAESSNNAVLAQLDITRVDPNGSTTTVARILVAEPTWSPDHQAGALNQLATHASAVTRELGTTEEEITSLYPFCLPATSRTVPETLDQLATYAAQAPLVVGSHDDYKQLANVVRDYAPGYGQNSPLPVWVTPESAKAATAPLPFMGISETPTPCKLLWQAAVLTTIAWEPPAGLPTAPALNAISPAQNIERAVRFLNGHHDTTTPEWKPLNTKESSTSNDTIPGLDAIPDGSTVHILEPLPAWFDLPAWAGFNNITFTNKRRDADWFIAGKTVKEASVLHPELNIAAYPSRPVPQQLPATPECPTKDQGYLEDTGGILPEPDYQSAVKAAIGAEPFEAPSLEAVTATPWRITKRAWQTPAIRSTAIINTLLYGTGIPALFYLSLNLFLESQSRPLVGCAGLLWSATVLTSILLSVFMLAVLLFYSLRCGEDEGDDDMFVPWHPGILLGSARVRFDRAFVHQVTTGTVWHPKPAKA